MSDPIERLDKQLICAECGARSSGQARAWRSYLTADDAGDDDGAAVFCPDCTEREFGRRDPTA